MHFDLELGTVLSYFSSSERCGFDYRREFKEVVKCLRKQNGADRVWNLGQVRNNVGNTP